MRTIRNIAALLAVPALLLLATSAQAADSWVPADGGANLYMEAGHDGPSDWNLSGMNTETDSWYYDHGDHLHPDDVVIFVDDNNNVIQKVTSVRIRTYKGKCISENSNPANFPGNCDGPGGGLTMITDNGDKTFTADWCDTSDHCSRHFAIHDYIGSFAGYQVTDTCVLTVPRTVVEKCEQEENKLSY
jgi:hypothetical protein